MFTIMKKDEIDKKWTNIKEKRTKTDEIDKINEIDEVDKYLQKWKWRNRQKMDEIKQKRTKTD